MKAVVSRPDLAIRAGAANIGGKEKQTWNGQHRSLKKCPSVARSPATPIPKFSPGCTFVFWAQPPAEDFLNGIAPAITAAGCARAVFTDKPGRRLSWPSRLRESIGFS